MAQGASVAEPSIFPANSIHMSMCNSTPALCVEYVAALEPPDFIVVHEMVQAYGALVEVAVTDDGRCCRWPDT
eukprot:2650063-Pyramimonas_sp.AAC.1